MALATRVPDEPDLFCQRRRGPQTPNFNASSKGKSRNVTAFRSTVVGSVNCLFLFGDALKTAFKSATRRAHLQWSPKDVARMSFLHP